MVWLKMYPSAKYFNLTGGYQIKNNDDRFYLSARRVFWQLFFLGIPEFQF